MEESKDIIRISVNGNGADMWISKTALELQIAWMKKQEMRMYNNWYDEDVSTLRHEHKRDLKWCYIYIGKTRKLAMMDIKTEKVYKTEGYHATWIEHKYFKFDRFCTPHDL